MNVAENLYVIEEIETVLAEAKLFIDCSSQSTGSPRSSNPNNFETTKPILAVSISHIFSVAHAFLTCSQP